MLISFGLVLLVLEVESLPYTSKSVGPSFQDTSAFNRFRREEQGGKTAVVGDRPMENNAAIEENAKSKFEDKSNSPLNCSLPSSSNVTICKDDGYVNSILSQMSENKGMLWRTLCVSLGVTGIVIIYFVIRAVRLRRRRSKSRKYGIITQHDHGDVEMEPLGDGNDDDDDYTVFEMNGKR
ncbi:membrane protein FAM174-like [Elysia marginata]|uniref:Membrane protein FAM174-like n=1 Tax=Elysia marginata TaxID=1093978 RepID=A0AAV4GNH8_9GAST|nr:membrane protein FAM174-like [Elysia marginata]